MSALKLTSKRQATLPKALCDELGVRSGDMLRAEPGVINGERVWILRPAERPAMPWFAKLKRFAKGKSHDMKFIRASIARGRQHGAE